MNSNLTLAEWLLLATLALQNMQLSVGLIVNFRSFVVSASQIAAIDDSSVLTPNTERTHLSRFVGVSKADKLQGDHSAY